MQAFGLGIFPAVEDAELGTKLKEVESRYALVIQEDVAKKVAESLERKKQVSV